MTDERKALMCRRCRCPIDCKAELAYAEPLVGYALSCGASGPDRHGEHVHGSPWQCLAAAVIREAEKR